MFARNWRLKLYKHMAKCEYCGSTIIFGGKRGANGRFCNQKCQARGGLLAAAIQQQIQQQKTQAASAGAPIR
jgi:hypothetical protein